MCLAIPGKVLHIDTTAQPVMGTVSFGGVQKSVCLDWIPELKVGEYVIVHVGFAISKMNEKDAQETLRLLEEMAEVKDELDPDEPASLSPSNGRKKPLS
ncbi:MAG TPA: HypC/HybG/HupF family hydrogenase formation chaperone [Bacteroidota bacterium]|nr:HypC/HybG/HupF family hydrogenase formation chaperone [Bacteroidota bacterium]